MLTFNGALPQLGKSPAVLDPRTFKLSDFLSVSIPPPPAEVSWVTKVPAWPVYLNDRIGDCVFAAQAHMIEAWNFYAGHAFQPSNAQVLKAYEDVGGYDPGNPSSDNGANLLAALKYWRKTGIGGHKILAFISVNFRNLTEVRQAILLFGSVYLGLQLPISAQGEWAWTVPAGGTYTYVGSPGGWGGHCVNLCASSPETHTCISWGQRLKMSHNFLYDYGDEAFVCLSQDWLDAQGLSPSQFNLAALQTALAAL